MLSQDNLIALQGFQRCHILDRAGLLALASGIGPGAAPAPPDSCLLDGGIHIGNSPFEF
jgi:hypothetical protein